MRVIILLTVLLGGCSSLPTQSVSTQTCVGSPLFGFQECVTVEHAAKLKHEVK